MSNIQKHLAICHLNLSLQKKEYALAKYCISKGDHIMGVFNRWQVLASIFFKPVKGTQIEFKYLQPWYYWLILRL